MSQKHGRRIAKRNGKTKSAVKAEKRSEQLKRKGTGSS